MKYDTGPQTLETFGYYKVVSSRKQPPSICHTLHPYNQRNYNGNLV